MTKPIKRRSQIAAWVLILGFLLAAGAAAASGHWFAACICGYASFHLRWGLAIAVEPED